MRQLASSSVVLAILALAIGYVGNAIWVGAGITLVVGLLWLAGQWRGWDWAADFGLICCVGLATFGIWSQLPAVWMLVGTVAALAAWDLDHFAERLRSVGNVVGQAELTRSHLGRLLVVGAAGLLIGAVALGVRLELSFGWSVFASMLAILSLRGLIGLLKREGE
jgi:hypothetical protein